MFSAPRASAGDRARSAASSPLALVPRLAAARGQGSPLPDAMAGSMASRFGHDFASVRVHADGEAAGLARGLQARAFTVGSDVFFGAGQYRPQSPDGRRLLAHELTHVLQQRRAAVDTRAVERPGSAAEHEADSVAQQVSLGGHAAPVRAVPTGITRDVGWANRGPIPDPYGMGYNTIFKSAGAASEPAVHDLRSLENKHMDIDVPTFDALPLARRKAVLALQPHAAGMACESWFAKMRNSPAHRADALTGAMSDRTGQLYWAGNSGPDAADGHRIRKSTGRPVDAAAPDMAAKAAGGSPTIATETNTNAFALWMRGGSAVPTGSAKMNCWEAIFFAAFEAGLVTVAQLRKTHADAAVAKAGYLGVVGRALGLDAARPLAALHPGRGGVVFFNGMDHVALSLGSRNAAGEHEVLSLWVLPPDPTKTRFVSTMQRTTIEELSRSMVTYIGKAPSVSFASNPF